MLNKMSLLLAAAAVALSAGAAGAEPNYNHHNRDHGSRLTFDVGAVAFGYNDGYWDTGHRWHAWRNQSDAASYRSHGQNFHGWNHDRDHDNGWHNR
jgi:opacity protein-like surface antigen